MEPIHTARDERESDPLMSDQAVDGVIAFISKYDKGEPKTVFWLQAVLGPAKARRLLGALGFGRRTPTFQDFLQHDQRAYWKLLEAAFSHPQARWEHFRDSHGNDIPFSIQNLEMLSENVRDEMVDFIKDANFWTGPE
jgi:hypothetical protein